MVYSERNAEFIEIHHVKSLHSIDEQVVISPNEDLVLVCSNCHMMMHRRKDNVLTVEKGINKIIY